MKKLCVLLVILSLTTAKAEDCSKCNEALDAAAEYIKSLEDGITVRSTVITRLEARSAALESDLQELERRQNSWYNSPFFLFGAGLIVGVAVAK